MLTFLNVDHDSNLLAVKLICPDGTVLQSRYRHDYVEHRDAVTGEVYMIDGGRYTPRATYDSECQLMFVYEEDDHSFVREEFEWGMWDEERGYIFVPIGKLSSPHVENLETYFLVYFDRVPQWLKNEQNYRKANNIFIEEYDYVEEFYDVALEVDVKPTLWERLKDFFKQ